MSADGTSAKDDPDVLWKRLKRLRLASQLSVSEVARRIGVAESTYRDWESGRAIRGEPYMRLAKLFKVSLTELMLGRDTSTREVLVDLDRIEELLQSIRQKL